jgi:hypothetical protein
VRCIVRWFSDIRAPEQSPGRIIRAAMKDAERLRHLLPLWLQRPPDKQTENDVLIFHAELLQNRPDLLVGGHGDSYQHLMADLRPYIKEPPKQPQK